MSKRVFIIHGWGGLANEGWLAWLSGELEHMELEVFSLQMPNTNEPRIKSWVEAIKEAAGEINEDTFFIGHSIGCEAIARYLEDLKTGTMVGGVVFVAGFFKRLTNMGDDELSRDIIHEWLDTPLDLAIVKSHLLKSLAIFSDDDPYVPMDNVDDFKNILNSKIIIKHKQGHFSGSSGLPKYPNILKHITDFIGN